MKTSSERRSTGPASRGAAIRESTEGHRARGSLRAGPSPFDQRPEASAQTGRQAMVDGSARASVQRFTAPQARPEAPGRSDLPDALRAGIESLSGISMDGVKVHRNSSRPAQLEANAYARGNEIFVAPGQEHHLPHEAWHVVQQRQGRVRPTVKMFGVDVNDDGALEAEATRLGARALRAGTLQRHARDDRPHDVPAATPAVQRDGQAPVQRNGNGDEKKDDEKDREKKAKQRMKRWVRRSEERKRRGRIPSGRYRTSTGPGTLSGMFGQRMSQTRKGDYGGKTFGSMPPYSKVKRYLPESELMSLVDPEHTSSSSLTDRQKMAGTLGSLLVHGSEEDREPGSGKFTRSLIRRRSRRGKRSKHPFDASINPAVGTGGAQDMRDFLAGKTSLTKEQVRAIEEASESSEEEDDYYPLRKGLWKRIEKKKKKKKKKRKRKEKEEVTILDEHPSKKKKEDDEDENDGNGGMGLGQLTSEILVT